MRLAFAVAGLALGTLVAARAAAEDAPQPLRVSGYSQVDWVAHQQLSQDELNYSTGAPLNQDRFLLRRARLRAETEQRFFRGALEIDANTVNGAQVRPINAEITAFWPERDTPNSPRFALTAGLIKIPFGFEVPERDYERPFLERSTMARAFFPGEFDLGARFSASFRFLSLSVAVMNGHPVGDRVFPAQTPNQKKEIIGCFGTHTELVPGVLFDAGISADTGSGFHPGNPTSKDKLAWRDDNGDGIVQGTEVQVIAGSSATPSGLFHRFALGADARLSLELRAHYRFELRAELIRASNLDRGLTVADPVATGYDLRELGWYLGATQEITEFGLVGARYDRYEPNQDAREQSAAQLVPRDTSYGSLALLGMLRYGNGRLSFQYDVNRNHLGRDSNGSPINLKSDAFTVRAQLRF